MSPTGMSSLDLEESIKNYGGQHMTSQFAGIYAADEVKDSVSIIKQLENTRNVEMLILIGGI